MFTPGFSPQVHSDSGSCDDILSQLPDEVGLGSVLDQTVDAVSLGLSQPLVHRAAAYLQPVVSQSGRKYCLTLYTIIAFGAQHRILSTGFVNTLSFH